jgi:hypothetical protein
MPLKLSNPIFESGDIIFGGWTTSVLVSVVYAFAVVQLTHFADHLAIAFGPPALVSTPAVCFDILFATGPASQGDIGLASLAGSLILGSRSTTLCSRHYNEWYDSWRIVPDFLVIRNPIIADNDYATDDFRNDFRGSAECPASSGKVPWRKYGEISVVGSFPIIYNRSCSDRQGCHPRAF